MKSFTERVKHNQEQQGLHVFRIYVPEHSKKYREPIDLICIKHGLTTFIRTRDNGHGNLQEATKLRLRALGKQCNAKVLYAKENGSEEIVFFRIYDRQN